MNRNDEITFLIEYSTENDTEEFFDRIDSIRRKLDEEQGKLKNPDLIIDGHRFKTDGNEEFDGSLDVEAKHELARANQIYPMFNSSAEGYQVLLEEIEEVCEETERIKIFADEIKAHVRNSKGHPYKINKRESEVIALIYQYAKLAIKELIQVMAMCLKYKKSF